VVAASLKKKGAMVVGGIGSWIKPSHKVPVTAATVVALVGLLRVLAYLT